MPRFVGVIGATFLLLATAVGPALGQSPSARLVGPDPVLGRALDGLEELGAYRLEQETTSAWSGGVPIAAVVEVVREPTFRLRFQIVDDGEAAVETVVVGEQGWHQQLGGPWQPSDGPGSMAYSEESMPFRLSVLEQLLQAGLQLEPVGEEAVGGRATIRHRGALLAPAATPAPGEYYVQSIAGTLDLWVDALDGFLVRAEADVRQFVGVGDAGPMDMRDVVSVSRVGDPTIAIEPPDLSARPAPSPGGDPALAGTFLAAVRALRDLASYRAVTDERTMGYAGAIEMIVVNRPEPVAQARFLLGGSVFEEILATEDRVWTRDTPDDPWIEAVGLDSLSCYAEPCTVGWLTGFDRELDGSLDTFTLVSDSEELDGVPVIHLRSTAGRVMPQTPLAPGVTDAWIAKDGGYLLRLDFDGQGTRSSVVISHVDDPANAVDAPPIVELTASPSASPGSLTEAS